MKLTKRQRYILERMRDGEELAAEGREVWIGTEKTSPMILVSLLRLCAISPDPLSHVYYQINETGRKMLNGDFSDLHSLIFKHGKA